MIAWGFMAAAFGGTGVGLILNETRLGLGWGCIVAALWCAFLAIQRADVGTHSE